MLAITVDRFDLQLLKEVQQNGQATNQELGKIVHLSTSQVSRRIVRLQDAGIIDHYCAVIEPAVVGLDVVAFTEVSLDRHNLSASDGFEQAVAQLPQVLECYTLAGQADYLLRVIVPDLAGFSDFMMKELLRIPGVSNARSTITLRRIKHTNVLPLDHLRTPKTSTTRIQFGT